MSYKIEVTTIFERDIKKLAKKYKSIKTDLSTLLEKLQDTPTLGSSLGQNCYKVRMPITSKGKGKSGGARVITYVYVEGEIVYLLTIFDKSDKETLSDKELKELLKVLGLN